MQLLPAGHVGVRPDVMMGASDSFTVKFHGKSGHR